MCNKKWPLLELQGEHLKTVIKLFSIIAYNGRTLKRQGIASKSGPVSD